MNLRIQIRPEVWKIFQNSRWHTYFERLQRLDEVVTIEFSLNLEGSSLRVHRLEIQVNEEFITMVNGLPQEGHEVVYYKKTLPKFPTLFLQVGETVMQKGKGYDRKSLPQP